MFSATLKSIRFVVLVVFLGALCFTSGWLVRNSRVHTDEANGSLGVESAEQRAEEASALAAEFFEQSAKAEEMLRSAFPYYYDHLRDPNICPYCGARD